MSTGGTIATLLVVGVVGAATFTYYDTAHPKTTIDCAGADTTVTARVEQAGRIVHSIAASEPSDATIQRDVLGVAGVLGTWASAAASAMRGDPRPDNATALQEQEVAIRQAAVVACSPCPLTGTATPTPARAPLAGDPASVAASAATAAGFTGDDLTIAVAVAGAESSWRPDAVNRANRNGSTDYGLWQINSIHRDVLASGDWSDPYANARMARTVWERAGGSWRPWVTYNSGAYRDYLTPAATATPATLLTPATSVGLAAPTVLVDGETVTVTSTTEGTVGAGCPEPSPILAAAASWPPGEPGPWGGHANGRIPEGELCPVPGATGHRLRCDAATALGDLLARYEATTGRPITVSSSYRTYQRQVELAVEKGLYKDGGLAAEPGTSDHGWALAADLGLDGQALSWMRANAGAFGFVEDVPREPWHWAYYGAPTTAGIEAG